MRVTWHIISNKDNLKDYSYLISIEREVFKAVENGDVKKVSKLLQQGKYNVNERHDYYTYKQETLLNFSCMRGKPDIVKLLLSEFEAEVNIRNCYGRTPLLSACERGYLDIVKVLVSEYKADLSLRDTAGCTALMLAARRGHEDVVIALLRDYPCPVTDVDIDGMGVLHHACAGGKVGIVQALVQDYKADVNLEDHNNNTPLQVAVNEGFIDVVFCLVFEFGCDPNVVDQQGKTPLHYACEKGNLELVNALIHDHKADVNACNNSKETPLVPRLPFDHYDVASCRIDECDFYPNVVGTPGWQTPLHQACKKGDIDLIHALVQDHKADINARDNLMKTPLHVAVEGGRSVAVLALVGCDPNKTDWKGQTPLHYACQRGDINLVHVLVKYHKADFNASDMLMRTPLHMALCDNQPDIAFGLFFELGCDPNVGCDRQGQALLHLACRSGDPNLVRTLVQDHKADVTLCNSHGNTPLHVAASAGHCDVVLVLVNEYGCDPSVQGYMARTPLHMASLGGHHKIVQILLNFTSPLVTDKKGNTPLHLASTWDHALTVKCLLQASAPPLIRNEDGYTTLDIAYGESKSLLNSFNRQILADYKKLSECSKKRFSGPHYLTRVFVIGNPGVGKSSLIESLKRDSFFQSLWSVSESSVPPHTAGIIPSVHMSKQYGRVLFYDFAGDPEYYSSHAAIFESLASFRGNNIFIIVADLRDVTMETTLHYWFTFIDYQKFRKSSFIAVGSHLDKCTNQSASLDQFCASVQPYVQNIKYFMMDCRDPRSNQIAHFKKQISTWVHESQKYELSSKAKLLLGLLERDFSAVTACPVQTLLSHIKQAGVWLPVEPKPFHNLLLELHEVGVVLLLGDGTKGTYHVILNSAKLTNEVHKLLFSESALSKVKKMKAGLNAVFLNIGSLPQDVLKELLPPYITTECLVHLQYCQKISHDDVKFFPCLEQADSTSQSFLFFPALCSVDKSQVPWDESTDTSSFTIGWLALCTRPHDYFPPRFLHVLLLRLVYGFTLSPARLQTAHASPQHSQRCTMWKKGVHWKMEEGVECMVELVNGSKGVVVLSKSSMDGAEECGRVFIKVVSCVMEAKAEFCHSTKPEFFLLDSSAEDDYFNEDHLFAVSDVERALESPEGKRVILSVSGRGEMELFKFQCMRKLTHWDNLFPIDFDAVSKVLIEIVRGLYELGQSLGVPHYIVHAIEADFPYDVSKRRRELVRWWMNSSQDPLCWYNLVQALRRIDENVLAESVQQGHGVHIQLQGELLCEETQGLKPDKEFLHSLSGVVGSRWPSLAVSLALSEAEIEGLKRKARLTQQELIESQLTQQAFTQQEFALKMLNIWASRQNATYAQLCQKLKTIHLFQ